MEKRGVASKILDGPRLRNIPMEEVMQLSLFEVGRETAGARGASGTAGSSQDYRAD
jgi:hypothetical protein